MSDLLGSHKTHYVKRANLETKTARLTPQKRLSAILRHEHPIKHQIHPESLEQFLSRLSAFLTFLFSSGFHRQTVSSRKLVCDLKRFLFLFH